LSLVTRRELIEAVSERHRKATEIHLDADVLDDAAMPAVDYRLPGGLSAAELSVILRTLVDSGKAVGLEITVFNPALDPDGSIACRFVRSIADGLATDRRI
jgi:arginase